MNNEGDITLEIDFRFVCLPLSASARFLLFLMLTNLVDDKTSVAQLSDLLSSTHVEIRRSLKELAEMGLVSTEEGKYFEYEFDMKFIEELLVYCVSHNDYIINNVKELSVQVPLEVVQAGVNKDLIFAAGFITISEQYGLSYENHAAIANCSVAMARKAVEIAEDNDYLFYNGAFDFQEVDKEKTLEYWEAIISTASGKKTNSRRKHPRIQKASELIMLETEKEIWH